MRLRWIALASALALGCQHLPRAEFHGFRIVRLEPDLSVPTARVTLELRIRLLNPLDEGVPIPRQRFRLHLDDQPAPVWQALVVPTPGHEIPAHGHVDLPYEFVLDPAAAPALGGLLGRDVAYRLGIDLLPPAPLAALGWWNDAIRIDGALRLGLPPEFRPRLDFDPASPTLPTLGVRVRAVDDPGATEPFDSPDDLARMKDLTIEIPIDVRNPNAFEIALPAARLELGGLLSMSLASDAGTGDLAAEETRPMRFIGTFHFDALGAGVLGLMNPSNVGAPIEGEFLFDAGYGELLVPFATCLTLNPSSASSGACP